MTSLRSSSRLGLSQKKTSNILLSYTPVSPASHSMRGTSGLTHLGKHTSRCAAAIIAAVVFCGWIMLAYRLPQSSGKPVPYQQLGMAMGMGGQQISNSISRVKAHWSWESSSGLLEIKELQIALQHSSDVRLDGAFATGNLYDVAFRSDMGTAQTFLEQSLVQLVGRDHEYNIGDSSHPYRIDMEKIEVT